MKSHAVTTIKNQKDAQVEASILEIEQLAKKESEVNEELWAVLRRYDYCHRMAKQRIGMTDFCTEHLLMKLVELEEPLGMQFVKK